MSEQNESLEPQAPATEERRIGVYICHCGGNISDYVDVAAVRDALKDEPGVIVAETTMFACSDGTQHDMINDIQKQGLDGLVVASCSPKLHQITFRGVAKRADMNPYAYTQVNIREQDSWVHGDDPAGATEKAIGLVRAGIAKSRNSVDLVPLVVETTSATMVVGAGIAGLRAAIGLADVGLHVYLVERQPEMGGWVGTFGTMFPSDQMGREQIAGLIAEVAKRPAITVFKNAELVGKSGSFGNYVAEVRINTAVPETIRATVGSIVIATGFDTYEPETGEFGYGIDGVVTLPQFRAMVDASDGGLTHNGRPVQSIAYIYCVGSRQPAGGNEYCSKFCCAASCHTSVEVAKLDPSIHQYHLNRDVRTYGKYELLYTQAREEGAVFMRYPDDTPPSVELGATGQLSVTTTDLLTQGEELTIPADLVVLVTGMVPRANADLTSLLKLPVGDDGFYNEIHPKLRPVETVVDGVMIAGTCQGPKTSAEAVGSGLAAVAQSAAILKKGVAELDPLVAVVNESACTGCGDCLPSCPYDAIEQTMCDGQNVALIIPSVCKGCGGCVPICPEDAIDLLGYTDVQMRAMIDGLVEVTV
ncbi:MAG: CoB--CoM heterodisulfide reductase iron-sulfur subunit A family protein [Actinomycetes bacterium]